ncbi:MAG TPA: DMT family transporter [Bryobacteraceae bacterium]|jgi:drug/metabolite transporter (DMT)-like permease|nr:DMT family transporter [Bryobacteraceae bacterium]
MTVEKPPGWLVDLSLVVVCLIWGATFILVKRALADISTLLFLTLRFTAAAVVLALIFRKQFRAPNLRMSLRAGLLAGLCLFSGYVLQTFGLKYTSASKTGFITGLYIPLVPLFSSIIYKKIPQMWELCGVAAAFAGMALMTIQTDLMDVNKGDLLVAGCAVVYAFHILLLGRFAGSANLGVLIVAQIATGMGVGAGTFWWAEPVRIQWTANVWIALIVTSLLATAFAFSVQTWAQRFSSPTRTALIFSMEPVFAWATSYVLAGEVLSRRGTVGAVLILAGILLVELKPKPTTN